jgi:histone deacetylase complex regulatory component SIN3
MMSIQNYLDLSQEIEQTVASIYQIFVERFAENPELCRLWRQMVQDEHDHAMQIKLAQPLVKEGMLGNSSLELEKVEALLRQARQLKVDVLARQMSPVAAFKLGLQMEERFCQIHLQAHFSLKRTDLGALFRRLARSDEAHIETLRQGLASCQGEAPS